MYHCVKCWAGVASPAEPGNAPNHMTTSKKLWLGFGVLTVLLVLSSLAIMRAAQAEHATAHQLEWLAALLLIVGGSIAVVTTVVISRAIAKAERHMEDARSFADSIVETVREPLLVLDGELRVVRVNRAFYQTFKVTPEETGTSLLYKVGNGQWDILELRTLLEDILPQHTEVHDFEVVHIFEHIGKKTMLLNARRLVQATDQAPLILLAIEDITERKQAEASTKEASQYARSLIEASLDPLVTISVEGKITDVNIATEQVTGASRDALIGSDFADYFTEPEKAREGYQQVFSQGSVTDYPLAIRHASGKVTDVLYNASVYRDSTGNVVGVFAAARDITERKQAEASTKEASQYARSLIEASLDPLVTISVEGKITDVNIATEQVTGASRDALIGSDFADYFTEPEKAREGYQQVFSQGSVTDYPLAIRHASGKVTDVLYNASVYRDSTGNVVGVFAAARDITERKRLEDELHQVATEIHEYTASIVATVREPLLVLDADLRVQSASRSFYENFRVTPEGTENRLLYDLGNRQWDIPALRQLLEEILPQENQVNDFSVEHEFEHIGKKTMLLNARRLIRATDQTPLILLAIEDITERKRLEDELRQIAAAMSEADRRKNEFLALLAHELRNPLAPIRSAVELMQLTNDPEANKAASGIVERQVDQMVRLVDDLLDVSRISRGKIELRKQRIDLASIVKQAIEDTRPLVKSMGHELTVTLPPEPLFLNADRTRLIQVLGNLLNNACKFTDTGGRISLAVDAVDGEAVIHVRDNGIGIAAEQLPTIFEMFVQADTSMERSVSGLGIGLALVKNMVEMHGGTVEVQSHGLGRGTTFVVRMTLIESPTLAPTIASADSGPDLTTAQRILVVDDNVDAAVMLERLLHLNGKQTRIAHSGLDGLEVAEQFRPHLILLDIGLPKLNGYEVCRRIRLQPWGKDMVVIALTGWGQEEDRKRSKEAGFNAHFVKPLERAALMLVLAGKYPVEA